MKERNRKNRAKEASQLELFNAESASQAALDEDQHDSKVISLADYKRQQEIRKFYDVARKLTAHLK